MPPPTTSFPPSRPTAQPPPPPPRGIAPSAPARESCGRGAASPPWSRSRDRRCSARCCRFATLRNCEPSRLEKRYTAARVLHRASRRTLGSPEQRDRRRLSRLPGGGLRSSPVRVGRSASLPLGAAGRRRSDRLSRHGVAAAATPSGLIAAGDRRGRPGPYIVLPEHFAPTPSSSCSPRSPLLLRRRRRATPAGTARPPSAAGSGLAIATHYFAGFVVAPRPALLLPGRSRRGRRVAVAVAAVVAAAALLLPVDRSSGRRRPRRYGSPISRLPSDWSGGSELVRRRQRRSSARRSYNRGVTARDPGGSGNRRVRGAADSARPIGANGGPGVAAIVAAPGCSLRPPSARRLRLLRRAQPDPGLRLAHRRHRRRLRRPPRRLGRDFALAGSFCLVAAVFTPRSTACRG